ncbi:hypothetical protein [Paenibacillus gansuensis]|uniref:Uncharacterized protein n=1 Tax=Paenibacillus gansuensis TaxID=306542 RepID=A0ABW5PGQ2_9BACL
MKKDHEFNEDKMMLDIPRFAELPLSDDETFSSFIPDHLRMFMFVTNNQNEIAKMQVIINGWKLEQMFIPYKASVAWVDFPETDNSLYEFQNYKYYDKDGNLIKEINWFVELTENVSEITREQIAAAAAPWFFIEVTGSLTWRQSV